MESPKTTKEAPVTTFNPDVESLEVKRLDEGIEPLMGPVVVGGKASADCFRYSGQLQAGRDRQTVDWLTPEANEPRKSPW